MKTVLTVFAFAAMVSLFVGEQMALEPDIIPDEESREVPAKPQRLAKKVDMRDLLQELDIHIREPLGRRPCVYVDRQVDHGTEYVIFDRESELCLGHVFYEEHQRSLNRPVQYSFNIELLRMGPQSFRDKRRLRRHLFRQESLKRMAMRHFKLGAVFDSKPLLALAVSDVTSVEVHVYDAQTMKFLGAFRLDMHDRLTFSYVERSNVDSFR